MRKNNAVRWLVTTSSLIAIAAPFAVAAAESGAPAKDDQSFTIEEIVVTSRKREERVQEIPDSIATFSSQMIEDAGITNVKDFVDFIPNVSFIQSQNQGSVAINIRGIGQVRNAEPPVAMVIDGVQIASPNQINQELYDIERIEVLKGPQGALYGRNAIGGAINIVTKQPTNEFDNFIKATASNGFDYKLQAGSSGPIIKDKLLYRIAGSYQDGNGVIHNETLDRDVDFIKDTNLRGRFLLFATDKLTFDLRLSYSKFKGGASWYIPLGDDDANNTTEPVQANVLGRGNRELQEYALKIDYETDFATLTSVSAYSSTKEFFFEDLDWLPAPILAAEQSLDVQAVSQELRLTSPSEQRLRWMVGGYYIETDRTIDTVLYADLGASNYLPLVNPHDDGKNKAIAGFGQLNYDITDALELTVGLRYDRDKRRQTSVFLGQTDQQPFSAWQPKFSLSYKWSDDAMTYITAGRGFRSGGFNQGSLSYPALYRAETNWNYEVGFKTSWLDRRLQLNGAMFWTDFDNQHLFLLDAATASQVIVNINKTRIKGVELDLTARPARGLDIFAAVGLMDAKIRDFNGTGLYDGNQSPLVNEWSYSLGLQYSQPIDDTYTLVGRVDYSAKGDLAWHVDNGDRQKSFNLVDVRLSLESAAGWRLTAFARNLFNEKYTEEFFAREYTGLATDIRWPNSPRRYGVEAVYRF